jgi:hypothetical protein
MVKFDTNLDLTMGKQVSISHPEGWGKGGDYDTPKQGVKPMKPEAIVTPGGGSGKWASGGGTVSVGKQSVGHCKPL